MARLALAVAESMLLGADLLLRLDRRTATDAARAGGAEVLLYRLLSRTTIAFLGRGRVAELIYEDERGSVSCRIDTISPFAEIVTSDREAALPRARSMLSLSDERFAEIIGLAKDPGPIDQKEAVDEVRDGGRTREMIYRQVLERWDYRCAMTGRQYAGATGSDTNLLVVPIRPRERGGPLHVRNFLPLSTGVKRAFEDGMIGVDADLNLLVRKSGVTADVAGLLPPTGKLLVPDNPDLGPDPVHLAYHFLFVCGGWAGLQSPFLE